jgi:hypothetical protein
MAAAFERCQGPALEVVELKYCGRCMSDKLLSDLCYKASNLHTLQLGGCYRLSVCVYVCVCVCVCERERERERERKRKRVRESNVYVCVVCV